MEWIFELLKQLSNMDFVVAMLISCFAGLFTGLDPCWIGTASSVLVFQNKSKKRIIFLPLLIIIISFITAFTLLGTISLLLGKQIIEWFEEYESMLNYFLAIIFMSMGFYMMDIKLCQVLNFFPFSILFSYKQKKCSQKQLNHHIQNSSYLGVLFAFTALPCTAPMFLAIISYYIINQSILGGIILFFLFALGHSIPFLVIGCLFEMLRSKGWIIHYHQKVNIIIGLILILFGIYLIFE